jgi:hypothetical protein
MRGEKCKSDEYIKFRNFYLNFRVLNLIIRFLDYIYMYSDNFVVFFLLFFVRQIKDFQTTTKLSIDIIYDAYI